MVLFVLGMLLGLLWVELNLLILDPFMKSLLIQRAPFQTVLCLSLKGALYYGGYQLLFLFPPIALLSGFLLGLATLCLFKVFEESRRYG